VRLGIANPSTFNFCTLFIFSKRRRLCETSTCQSNSKAVTSDSMDPVTALGVASSIVQLIQFGSSLSSQANHIYRSAEGALPEHIECDSARKRLMDLSDQVKQSMRDARVVGNRPNPGAQALEDICNGCVEVSRELQKLLPSSCH